MRSLFFILVLNPILLFLAFHVRRPPQSRKMAFKAFIANPMRDQSFAVVFLEIAVFMRNLPLAIDLFRIAPRAKYSEIHQRDTISPGSHASMARRPLVFLLTNNLRLLGNGYT